jgi:hypothetical protein
MKTKPKVAIFILLVVAFALAAFFPVLPGPNATCGGPAGPGGPTCIPDQKFSITQAYLGFGSESSYNGTFYCLCGIPNFEGLTHAPSC